MFNPQRKVMEDRLADLNKRLEEEEKKGTTFTERLEKYREVRGLRFIEIWLISVCTIGLPASLLIHLYDVFPCFR